jgi:TrmH family RNA methyltransferase
MGSVARVRVVKADLHSLLDKIRGRIPVYGTFLEGDNIYDKTLGTEGFIVIGSEAHGISAGLSSGITDRLFIPSFGSSGTGKAESLNAAVATAIVISEFRRRTS